MSASAGPATADQPRARRVAPAARAPREVRPATPAVVRRRRILAVAGLVAVAVVFALAVVPGGESQASKIATLLQSGTARPAVFCDHLSAGMSAAAGGRAGCLAASPRQGPRGTVGDVRVHGATATAVITSKAAGVEHYRLVRQDGDWKVDDVW